MRDRYGLCQALQDKGICLKPWWSPIHRQAPYRMPDEAFPKSIALCGDAVWLPSAFTLRDNDVQSVCEAIREVYG